MKREKGMVAGNIIVLILTISVVIIFIGITLFGFVGVVKVGTYFNLVEINVYPSLFANAFYFGSLLFLIFILLLCIEMIVKVGLKLGKVAQSLTSIILSYAVQIVLGTLAIKLLVDHTFERIEVSLLGVSISVVILYVIVFFASGAHKGMDDVWDD